MPEETVKIPETPEEVADFVNHVDNTALWLETAYYISLLLALAVFILVSDSFLNFALLAGVLIISGVVGQLHYDFNLTAMKSPTYQRGAYGVVIVPEDVMKKEFDETVRDYTKELSNRIKELERENNLLKSKLNA